MTRHGTWTSVVGKYSHQILLLSLGFDFDFFLIFLLHMF